MHCLDVDSAFYHSLQLMQWMSRGAEGLWRPIAAAAAVLQHRRNIPPGVVFKGL